MKTNTSNQMTSEEKANYFFQKFKTDFDDCECQPSNNTSENCEENIVKRL